MYITILRLLFADSYNSARKELPLKSYLRTLNRSREKHKLKNVQCLYI